MALTKIPNTTMADPDAIIALNKSFTLVEILPFTGLEPLYKTVRLKGQGVPDSDAYVNIRFEIPLGGKVRVGGWSPADGIV